MVLTAVVSAAVAAIAGIRMAQQTLPPTGPGVAARSDPSAPAGGDRPRARATEMATQQFLARVASGDLRGTRQLLAPTAGPPHPPDAAANQDWLANLAAMRPRVLRTATLPGPAPAADEPARAAVLAWVQYRWQGPGAGEGQGALFVDLEFVPGPPGAWRVRSVTGPVVPQGGYSRLPLILYSALGVPLSGERGPAILWTPRRPEGPLVGAMQRLWAEQHGRLEAALVLDMTSPADWDRFARANGWQGPVYRTKQRLDQVPVAQVQPYHGAVGVLIDRSSHVVASLGALDPSRYGLLPDPAGRLESQVADQVLAAYGVSR